MDKKVIAEHHKQASHHLEQAAQCHKEAAKHLEAGEHDKAVCEAHKAHGHICCAVEHATEASMCCVEHKGCCKK